MIIFQPNNKISSILVHSDENLSLDLIEVGMFLNWSQHISPGQQEQATVLSSDATI